MAKVHILGAGAIGLSFANLLSKKHSVTLLTRSPTQTPFYFVENNHKQLLNAKSSTVHQLANKEVENAFICVKAHQLELAFDSLIPYLANHANIFISHNGIQNLEVITNKLTSTQCLYFISTASGALKTSANTAKQTGIGDTYIGACNKPAERHIKSVFKALFDKQFPLCAIHPDIALLRWQKLLVNIAINPLSALYQVRNGQLRQPKYASEVFNLVNEACMVANALGIKVTLASALNNGYLVMQRTQHNYSSMAQDIKHHRQSEIDAICGYIVSQAQQLGIRVPHNTHMLHCISSLYKKTED